MQTTIEINHTDKSAIDKLTQVFFSIFTTTDLQQPDWTIINDICVPETLIIKISDNAELMYDLQSFIEPRRKILSDGTLTNFEESEIKEETTIKGHIAQRSSRYQKCGYLNGKFFNEFGNKFFQFIKTNKGWKINSLIWEDDNT